MVVICHNRQTRWSGRFGRDVPEEGHNLDCGVAGSALHFHGAVHRQMACLSLGQAEGTIGPGASHKPTKICSCQNGVHRARTGVLPGPSGHHAHRAEKKLPRDRPAGLNLVVSVINPSERLGSVASWRACLSARTLRRVVAEGSCVRLPGGWWKTKKPGVGPRKQRTRNATVHKGGCLCPSPRLCRPTPSQTCSKKKESCLLLLRNKTRKNYRRCRAWWSSPTRCRDPHAKEKKET
eukprot:scaffold840_cov344-Pavlova_lutheri.AAC.51